MFGRSVWSWATRCLLSRKNSPGLSVLIFHRVLDRFDPMRPSETLDKEFESVIRFLAENFSVRPLVPAISDICRRRSTGHSVAITFDDGYADNLEVAMPILRRYSAPATFFVTSGVLGDGMMWNDRIIEAVRNAESAHLDLGPINLGNFDLQTDDMRYAAIRKIIATLKYRDPKERENLVAAIGELSGGAPAKPLMMNALQLRELAEDPLAEIGGHTVTHPILSNLSASAAMSEIGAGKEAIEEIVGHKLQAFAYPNGVPGKDYSAKHVEMVKACGFSVAVSTSLGGFTVEGDRYQVPRISPWDRRPNRFGLRMLLASRESGQRAV